jgi:uncharacterized alkaline shock family protein YloU
MADMTTPSTPQSEAPSPGPGRLETERGSTTIAEVVVTKVAGIAAREVGGVHRLGTAVSRALGAVTQRLQVTDSSTQGVNVDVTDTDARVSMSVVIDYGESIPEVAQAIRDNVVRRIESTTGLHCAAVDIAVTDLYFPGEDDDDQPAAPAAGYAAGGAVRARRAVAAGCARGARPRRRTQRLRRGRARRRPRRPVRDRGQRRADRRRALPGRPRRL